MTKLCLFPLIVLVTSSLSWGASQAILTKGQTVFRIELETLGVWATPKTGAPETELAAPLSPSLEVSQSKITDTFVSYQLKGRDLRVTFRLEESGLLAHFETTTEQSLEWPLTGRPPDTEAILLPVSEGLYVPPADPLWTSRVQEDECFAATGDLSVPAWGLLQATRGFSFMLPSELETTVCLRNAGKQLAVVAKHAFRARDRYRPFEVFLQPTARSPLAPALAYRAWLKRNHKFVSLERKIQENPEVSKLLGATHIYLFGTGRALPALKKLKALNLSALWLGYDQDPRSDRWVISNEQINWARDQGYLIGPYDTFDNVQDPKNADAVSSLFDEKLYEQGGILTADGKRMKGFAGRGFQLSSEALRKTRYFENRMAHHAEQRINSLFLDCDAFGNLFDDFDPNHPMTPEVDQKNRIARMDYISRTMRWVLGSERAAGWSAPFLHFSHGTHTLDLSPLYKILSNKDRFGGWAPVLRPGIFFQQIPTPAELKPIHFNPRYRLPFFQAVFHDSVITTDRWEFSPVKFTDDRVPRELLRVLYNVPAVWNLDKKAIDDEATALAKSAQFFESVHRKTGLFALLDFSFLSADRLVQRTSWGPSAEDPEATITANFRSDPYRGLAAQCAKIEWKKEGKTEIYCPKAFF